jgi:hypothetical protein
LHLEHLGREGDGVRKWTNQKSASQSK